LLIASGCFELEVGSSRHEPAVEDGGTGAQSPLPDAAEPTAKVDAVDLLLVMDNSGSMASEQMRLQQQMERIVEVLTTGDRKPKSAQDPSDATRYFTPVKSLHLGVVSTNMGGNDAPAGSSPALHSCRGLGDDGRLQNDVSVARDGVVAQYSFAFEGFGQGEVVLPADPSCDLANVPAYLELGADASPGDVAQAAKTFSCVARRGVTGCPFEQPLEAMWKALAPSQGSGQLHEFLNGSRGHGDGANAGFLRPDALLVVVHVSDEEDCSIKQEGKGLFDNERQSQAELLYGTEINLRCGRFGESLGLVWPTERYVEGLKSLKPGHPERIIFSALVGVPQNVSPGLTSDELLALPEMQFRQRPDAPGLPAPSCIRDNAEYPARTDSASPGRRFVQVAKGFGENGAVHSICADDYTPALDHVVTRIAAALQ
jgi:hypothetical protein